MELRQLKYFAKIAETLNFSEAAKQLFITQSTLSQQIKQLEAELDTPLLSRSSHHVALTEAGRLIYDHAKRTLHEADLCVQQIHDLNNLATGTLNIGVTYSFSPMLTETLISFMKLYPRIRLNIFYKSMSELMQMLRSGEVDFVLAFKPSQAVDGIESHILFQNFLSVVVGMNHPLAARDRITVPELEHYDLALPSKGLQARNAFDEIISPYASLKVRIELNEVNILLKLVRQSMLVTVLAETSTLNEPMVKSIPLDIPDNSMAGCVHTLKNAYRKRSMQEFIRMLGESVAVKERRIDWL